MKLRHKIFLYFGSFIFFLVLIQVIVNYQVLERNLHNNAKEEIRKIVESVNTAAATVLDSSIRNYLRGVVEQDFDILEKLYSQSQKGLLTEQQAKDAFQEHVLEHVIGESGYIVALRPENEKIWIDIHPHVRGIDCAFNQGCQEWATQKNGYNQYEWKNPKDEETRQKVGYFQYFEPWNWIVGATSYRDEFTSLVKIDDLRDLIEPFTILENGYFFVLDEKYTVLIHPELEGEYVYDIQNEEGVYIVQEITRNLNDFFYYQWRNPSEEAESEKFVYTKVLEDFNWYVCATGYLDDVTAPIRELLYIRLVFIAVVAVVLLLITFFLSRNLTRPLDALIQGINGFYQDRKVFKPRYKSVYELDSVGYAIESMTENLLLAEKEKQQLLDELNSIINSMPSMLIGADVAGKVTFWNTKAQEHLGLSKEEALGRTVGEVMAEFKEELTPLKKSIQSQTYYSHSFAITKDGTTDKHFHITFYPLSASTQSAVIRIDDITDRVMMEESLMQSRKMESLGTLAGGIAHDFNNILSAIYGYSELIRNKLEPGDSSLEMHTQLIMAADRAKDLVQQILLFSRQAEHKKRPIEPHLIIKETIKLLRSSIPTTIEIKQKIPRDCGSILASPTQLHQIIMNLCTNGYHAMREQGGVLSVTLSTITLSTNDISTMKTDVSPGNYVQLEVSDTGHGMDQKTLAKVFDPFFTTKNVGEGTGLGLSVVHGIVKSCEGFIDIQSEPGKGTTITLVFPRLEVESYTPEILEESSLPTGNEHILLVDDEEPLLDTTSRLLEDLGYTITKFSSSVDALDAFSANPERFDLVITDMTMPQMTGLDLTKKLFGIKSGFPVIMCTGFSELINKEQAFDAGIKGFLAKPVLNVELAKTIRDVMDS